MTFRPPSTKPTRRRARRTDSRHSLFLNIAFGLAAIAAVALLVGVLGANWYSDHGAPIASVDGVAISKDAVRARAEARIAVANRELADYDTLRNQGKITTVDEQQLTSTISTDSSTAYSDAMSDLTDAQMLRDYASKHGISVSEADVDAQIVKDGTLPEFRHVKVIAVEPAITPPGAVASAADVATAQALEQSYVDEVKGGKKWDDVFKESQTANPVVSSSGDMGMNSRESLNLDPDLVDAIFSLKNVDDITPIMRGQDGILRVATVSAILPAYPDTGWKDAINNSGNGDEYRRMATDEALKAKIQAQVEGQYVSGASDARHVEDILIAANPYSQAGAGNEARAQFVVFAPNHDVNGAANVSQADPAWTEAKDRAQAAYETLKKDPSQITKMALDTKVNDDQYLASIAGQLPWLTEGVYEGDATQQQGLGMIAVPIVIFNPSTQLGIQEPVLEPSMGWVVVNFQGLRQSPEARIADVQLALGTGTDFAAVARQYSEAVDATSGADMGWVFKYQLSTDLQDAIWQAPVGGVTRVVQDTDGWHIYKVLADETRTPDAAQQLTLKSKVFQTWLSDLRGETNIWTDYTGLTAITPTSTP